MSEKYSDQHKDNNGSAAIASKPSGEQEGRIQANMQEKRFESSFQYALRNLRISSNMDWTAKFTGVLCVVAVLQWLTFEKQLRALDNTDRTIKSQLTASLAEQRPWAKVTFSTLPLPIPPNGFFMSEMPAIIPFGVTIENVGKSPMLHIRERHDVFIPGVHGENVFDSWHAYCKFVRETNNDVWDQGKALFPSDKLVPTIDEPVGPMLAAIQDEILKVIPSDKAGKRTISIYIFGCVNYISSADWELHQTRFLVRAWRRRQEFSSQLEDFDLSESLSGKIIWDCITFAA